MTPKACITSAVRFGCRTIFPTIVAASYSQRNSQHSQRYIYFLQNRTVAERRSHDCRAAAVRAVRNIQKQLQKIVRQPYDRRTTVVRQSYDFIGKRAAAVRLFGFVGGNFVRSVRPVRQPYGCRTTSWNAVRLSYEII